MIPVESNKMVYDGRIKQNNYLMEEYNNKIHDKYTRGNLLQIEKFYRNKYFDVVVLIGAISEKKSG